ncbi:MAG TPA: hypothetical protein VIT67_12395 [Povalibacter sp.]
MAIGNVITMGGNLRAAWLALPLVIAMAGCATTGPNLATSAERLERNSYAMERGSDTGRVREDARRLSEETHDFRRVLGSRSVDHRDIERAFDDVSRTYHSLRDEVERSRDRLVERDFEPVTNAYLDVEREMSRSDRYARD